MPTIITSRILLRKLANRDFFSAVKIENFITKSLILLIFLLKTLIVGGSNEYPQSMFWIKNMKIGIPLQTPVFIHKSGV